MKTRVAMMFGGKTVEHEVSVISGIQALKAMDTDKYEVIPVYMTKENKKTVADFHEQNMEKLKAFRPIDDEFMRIILRNNKPLAEFILQVITDKKDLKITEEVTQYDLKRLVGARAICLDAYCTDDAGKKYDIEIQRADAGANPHRARYHSSAMDVENLSSGQDFTELPDTYTIFITEKDFYGTGLPVYLIDRVNKGTGQDFGDGEHIIYVNGEYEGDSEIGDLMHDFRCSDGNDMWCPLLAEATNYYKKDSKGVMEVSKIMDEFKEEVLYDDRVDTAKRIIEFGNISLEQISQVTKLPLEVIQKLANPEVNNG